MYLHTGNSVDKDTIASIDILCIVKRHMRLYTSAVTVTRT